MTQAHYLQIDGDAFNRGRTHGGELRLQVSECVEFYRGVLGLGEAVLVERAGLYERLIESYSPTLAQEIRGIAEGAGLPPAHLFAVNARSELVPFDAGECTALYTPSTGVLAQTWDWCRQLEQLVTVLSIRLEDGREVLTVTEPGIVGKIGLCSEGFGVCLNFLSAPRSNDGAPIHVLLREALDAPSLEAARGRLRQAGTGRGGNILLADAGGEAFNFEFAGDASDERAVTGNFCHTNHCLFRDLAAGDMEENSKARWTRAEELLEGAAAASVEDVKRILSDRRDADAPICAPYQPLFGLELGTLCTAVMDLPDRRLHLRMGADPEADFRVYSL